MSTAQRIKTAVVNGTGYGGAELLRLLQRHPTFDLLEVTARSDAGKPIGAVLPHLAHLALTFGERVTQAELVFVALPDHAAVELIPELLAAGRRVVDLSGGFRLRSAALYPEWYGYPHDAPALLETAVYGLAEWNRKAIAGAQLVACPGCYPTATLLALWPALTHHLIEPDIVVDAKSGVSGAGRTLKLASHFSEVNEDVSAYGLDGHRHWPEIHQELSRAASAAVQLTFIPHLVPMTRGILASSYARLQPGVSAEDVRTAYTAAYADEPFVRVVAQPPHTKWALGSNVCFVHPSVDVRSQRLVVISALDNLVKGAAGQAIQCANRMYGFTEELGLPREGVFP
jgi:N-acetyl-gamma-glutamyl-phosphate reductase